MKSPTGRMLCFILLFLAGGSRGGDLPIKPLGELLGEDGRLRVPAGFNGSLNPAGYQMVLDGAGAPRFVSTNSPGSGRKRDLGGAASLEDGWDIRFSRSGVSGFPNDAGALQVSAVASDGTNLYVGGSFFAVGQTLATNIACWDGAHWRPLGLGIPSLNNDSVTAIAIQGTNVYAGGAFGVAGDQYANSIARWDGVSWSALGQGTLNGVRSSGGAGAVSVTALLAAGGDLYVGGAFDTAGGQPAANVALWDGSQWQVMGGGVAGSVNCLAANGGGIYAASSMTGRVQVWNGAQWSGLGLGPGGYIFSMAFLGTNLVCSMSASTDSDGVLALWNGQTWSPLPIATSDGGAIAYTGTPGYQYFYESGPVVNLGANLFLATSVQTTNGSIVTGLLRWNGTNWTMMDGGLTTGFLGDSDLSQLSAACSDGKSIFLAGNFDSLHDVQSAAGIVASDGQHLTALDEGTGQGIPVISIGSGFPQ